MRERDRESYDVERRNGAGNRCCIANAEQLRNLKRKTYEELNGNLRTEGPEEERTDQDEKGETRRRIYYWSGVPSGGREVGDECGWI